MARDEGGNKFANLRRPYCGYRNIQYGNGKDVCMTER